MSYTFLVTDGFESSTGLADKYLSTYERDGTINAVTPGVYSYGRYIAITNSANWFSPYVAGGGMAYQSLYSAFHFQAGTNYTSESAVAAFYDDAAEQQQITLTLQYVSGDGKFTLRVRRGTSTGTLLATATAAVPASGTWCHISVMALIHDSTGRVKVNVDSTNVIDFTGNTRNTANNRVDRIRLWGYSSPGHYFDNFVVATGDPSNDPPLPVIRIYTQLPNDNDVVAFSVSGASWNYGAVNEVTPNGDTSYTYSSTVGAQDTFKHAAPSIVSTVLGVRVYHCSRKDDAGDRDVQPVLKPSNTAYSAASSDYMNPRYWVRSSPVWTTNPDTSLTWTPAEAMNAKFGYKVSE